MNGQPKHTKGEKPGICAHVLRKVHSRSIGQRIECKFKFKLTRNTGYSHSGDQNGSPLNLQFAMFIQLMNWNFRCNLIGEKVSMDVRWPKVTVRRPHLKNCLSIHSFNSIVCAQSFNAHQWIQSYINSQHTTGAKSTTSSQVKIKIKILYTALPIFAVVFGVESRAAAARCGSFLDRQYSRIEQSSIHGHSGKLSS